MGVYLRHKNAEFQVKDNILSEIYLYNFSPNIASFWVRHFSILPDKVGIFVVIWMGYYAE